MWIRRMKLINLILFGFLVSLMCIVKCGLAGRIKH